MDPSTSWFASGICLSPYLFDLVMDVLSLGIRDQSPWWMLFANNIMLCSTNRVVVESKLEQWRKNQYKGQRKSVENSSETSFDVRGRNMASKESARQEIGCGRDENARVDVRSNKNGQDQQ
ncbi:uncharacterized protein [Macrobrachium rosenbergii]|uniref:uncharacterized protein n=1 Tax=Macrobrachium rosenbergii TaxID=79674 RepID=UPI0034D44A63